MQTVRPDFMHGLLLCSRRIPAAAFDPAVDGGFAGTPPVTEPLTLATGTPGGGFFDYGPGFADAVRKNSSLRIAVRSTGGSNENIMLVEKGEAQLGLVSMGPAYDAVNARPEWKGPQPRNLRALLPMYETPFHTITLAASGIVGFRQLDGRRVGVGPKDGPGEAYFSAVADGIGIRPAMVHGSPSELAGRLADRSIDAFWFGAGVPISAFSGIAVVTPARVFGLAQDEVAAIRKAFPYAAPYTIPANSYHGQAAPLQTVAIWNFVLVNKDVPDKVAHELLRSALAGRADIVRAYAAAKGTDLANILSNDFMPFHPGAIRYLNEMKVAVPASLRT